MKNLSFGNILMTLLLSSCTHSNDPFLRDYPKQYIITISHLNLLPSHNLIYVFTDYCGHCANIKNQVLDLYNKITTPLYFLRLDESIPIVDSYIEVLEADYPNEIKVIGVPSLFVIENKKITSYHMGESDVLNVLNSYLPTPL